MLTETDRTAVQDKAEKLAEEIRQRTAKIAEELLTLKRVQVQTDDPLLALRYRLRSVASVRQHLGANSDDPWEKCDDSFKSVKLNDLSRRSGARRRNGSEGPLGRMEKVFS
jgi:hypothetical protein